MTRKSEIDIAGLEAKLAWLHRAIAERQRAENCLRLWSAFVQARDGHRCVDCRRSRHLAAHHVCRKSFLPEARFQTGNGITLCRDCHREVHGGFNGRADLSLPMDAQGGEKIDTMERLYAVLRDDARALPSPGRFLFSQQLRAGALQNVSGIRAVGRVPRISARAGVHDLERAAAEHPASRACGERLQATAKTDPAGDSDAVHR